MNHAGLHIVVLYQALTSYMRKSTYSNLVSFQYCTVYPYKTVCHFHISGTLPVNMNVVKQCFLHPFLTPSPTPETQGATTYLLDKSIQNNSRLKRSYLFFGNFLKLLWNCAVYIFNAILMKAIKVWSFWFAIVRLLQRIQTILTNNFVLNFIAVVGKHIPYWRHSSRHYSNN